MMYEDFRCPFCLQRCDLGIEHEGMCLDCATKRLRRHEKHADALANLAKSLGAALHADNQSLLLVNAAFENEIDLSELFADGSGRWWHYNTEQVMVMVARDEISEGAAAAFLDMGIVEFRLFREQNE